MYLSSCIAPLLCAIYVANDQRCLHFHTMYASSYVHVLKHDYIAGDMYIHVHVRTYAFTELCICDGHSAIRCM